MTDTIAGRGHNLPPTPADVFDPQIAKLNTELVRLTGGEITASVAADLRDLQKKARELELQLDAAKASDKQPHLDANKAIEASYRPLVEGALEIKAAARKHVDVFLKAEEDRRIAEAAEAKRVADEAAAKAKKAAEEAEDDNPFAELGADDAAHEANLAAIAAEHAERKASAGASIRGRSANAASLRSYYSVRVVDAKAMVAHFAADRDVIDMATRAANAMARATKGSMPIPGCEIVEDRRSV